MSVISDNVVSLRQTSLLPIKSSKRVTKVIPQQNYCPWEGSDKVVIHGIIMIVSFAELSLWGVTP